MKIERFEDIEGWKKGREFIRFLGYAQRSATEVMSCLYVALDNVYITQSEFDDTYALAHEAGSLVGGFIKYLKSKRTKHQPAKH